MKNSRGQISAHFKDNRADKLSVDPYAFYDSILESLTDMGITSRQRPKVEKEHAVLFSGLQKGDYFDGRLPTVIRNFGIDKLSDLHALFSAWFAYVTFQAKFLEARTAEARGSKERLLVLLKKKYREEGKAAALVVDYAKADARYLDSDAHFLKLKSLLECVSAAVNICEQDLKTISREVTRERMKLDREIHKGNFPSTYSERGVYKGDSRVTQRKYGK